MLVLPSGKGGWLPATRQPLRDGVATAAIAIQVLYLVADPLRAVTELRRVLRPGGVAVVATSGPEDKRELEQLLMEAMAGVPPAAEVRRSNWHHWFEVSDAVHTMDRCFDDVRVHELNSDIRLRGPQPLVRYVNSLRWSFEPALTSSTSWTQVMARVRSLAVERLSRSAELAIRTQIGLIVGRRGGD